MAESSVPGADQLTIATRTFRLWTWMRPVENGLGYEESPTAPHRRFDHLPWDDPSNQFGIVWMDKQHTNPHRVIDGDGCTAAVIGVDE